VVNITKKGNLKRLITGNELGTIVEK